MCSTTEYGVWLRRGPLAPGQHGVWTMEYCLAFVAQREYRVCGYIFSDFRIKNTLGWSHWELGPEVW